MPGMKGSRMSLNTTEERSRRQRAPQSQKPRAACAAKIHASPAVHLRVAGPGHVPHPLRRDRRRRKRPSRRRPPPWPIGSKTAELDAEGMSPSTSAARAICAAVLIFETDSGFTRTGLPSHDRSIAADDEQVAGDHHDQPAGQHALEDRERHEDGDEQRLVGDRIEIGAELARRMSKRLAMKPSAASDDASRNEEHGRDARNGRQ